MIEANPCLIVIHTKAARERLSDVQLSVVPEAPTAAHPGQPVRRIIKPKLYSDSNCRTTPPPRPDTPNTS